MSEDRLDPIDPTDPWSIFKVNTQNLSPKEFAALAARAKEDQKQTAVINPTTKER
ncbi:MAG: hypothetical protein ACREQ5_11905 [Candidatus Dormibacteria bacterium]